MPRGKAKQLVEEGGEQVEGAVAGQVSGAEAGQAEEAAEQVVAALEGGASGNVQYGMNTLLIDNGSKYLEGIETHVNTAAEKLGVEGHSLEKKSMKELKGMYVASVKEDKESGVPEKEWGKAFKQYIKGFQYIVSSGSPRLAKYDQKMHEKISDAASDAVFLGVCHGAQQLASAYGAKLKKTKHTHQGKRGADVNEAHLENPALEGTHEGGHMENYGHHKWYIPVDQAGSNLEVIAESESPKTKDKFVEMFKLSGKDHYGAQFHPEKGDGELIFNTFGLAHKKYKKAA